MIYSDKLFYADDFYIIFEHEDILEISRILNNDITNICDRQLIHSGLKHLCLILQLYLLGFQLFKVENFQVIFEKVEIAYFFQRLYFVVAVSQS